MGGVELAATAFANMSEDASVTPMGLRAKMWLLLLWALSFFVGVVSRMVSTVMAGGAVLVLSLLYVGGAAYAFENAFSPVSPS